MFTGWIISTTYKFAIRDLFYHETNMKNRGAIGGLFNISMACVIELRLLIILVIIGLALLIIIVGSRSCNIRHNSYSWYNSVMSYYFIGIKHRRICDKFIKCAERRTKYIKYIYLNSIFYKRRCWN